MFWNGHTGSGVRTPKHPFSKHVKTLIIWPFSVWLTYRNSPFCSGDWVVAEEDLTLHRKKYLTFFPSLHNVLTWTWSRIVPIVVILMHSRKIAWWWVQKLTGKSYLYREAWIGRFENTGKVCWPFAFPESLTSLILWKPESSWPREEHFTDGILLFSQPWEHILIAHVSPSQSKAAN